MDTNEGRFVWADLTTPDCPAATLFYSALLGWDMDDVESALGTYVVGKVDGKQIAGMMAQDPSQQNMPPMWQIYQGSEHLEDTLIRIEAAHGSVMVPPMENWSEPSETLRDWKLMVIWSSSSRTRSIPPLAVRAPFMTVPSSQKLLNVNEASKAPVPSSALTV